MKLFHLCLVTIFAVFVTVNAYVLPQDDGSNIDQYQKPLSAITKNKDEQIEAVAVAAVAVVQKPQTQSSTKDGEIESDYLSDESSTDSSLTSESESVTDIIDNEDGSGLEHKSLKGKIGKIFGKGGKGCKNSRKGCNNRPKKECKKGSKKCGGSGGGKINWGNVIDTGVEVVEGIINKGNGNNNNNGDDNDQDYQPSRNSGRSQRNDRRRNNNNNDDDDFDGDFGDDDMDIFI